MSLSRRIISKLNREFKYTWNDFEALAGANERFYKNARGARIVCYHGICLKDHTKFNGIFLRRDTFEKHLQFYKKYFHVVSLDDYYKEKFNTGKFNICITFDDGYYNNLKYVLPLMERYKVPVTFFLTAIKDAGYDILWNDFLGIVTKYGPGKIHFQSEDFFKGKTHYTSSVTNKTLPGLLIKKNFSAKHEMMNFFSDIVSFRDKKEDEDFWLQMNLNDIRQLASSSYSTIGAHGYYHNDLSEISIEESKKELSESKIFLENTCGKKINALAFPYGHYTRDVVFEAKKIGYDQLYALDFHFSEDKNDNSMRERMIVNPYISVINQMYAIVKGSYE